MGRLRHASRRRPVAALGPVSLRGLAFIVASLATTSLALAQDAAWDATFTANTLRDHVTPSTRVVVVAAGTELSEARAAARTLTTQLRTLRAALVMDDQGLGDVSTLDDAAIRQRCVPLPIEHVMIVRVFPGATNTPPSAVAILYDRNGNVITAINGTRGQSMPAVAASNEVGAPVVSHGVDLRAESAVNDVRIDLRRRHEQNRERYNNEYVRVESVRAHLSSGWTAYRGNSNQSIIGESFYLTVERPDLAERYRSRNKLKWGFFIAGVATVAIGASVTTYGLLTSETERCEAYDYIDRDECIEYEDNFTVALVGAALVLIGTPMVVIPVHAKAHTINVDQARRIADEHNQRLRQRLGLSSESAALRIPQAPKARFSWDAFASHRGAGLSLRLAL